MELFEPEKQKPSQLPLRPLAERCRPETLEEFVGQTHLLGKGKTLQLLLEKGKPGSMIFWGPPGVGKTTLAKLMAAYVRADFISVSAVTSGVEEIRKIIQKAELQRKIGKPTILFIDEIHRFNKAQQDALLHPVESGVITLIGATTENPSFEVISPLLSRSRVFTLQALSDDEIKQIIRNALKKDEYLKSENISLEGLEDLVFLSGGDARNALNILELAIQITKPNREGKKHIDPEVIQEAAQRKSLLYDKKGEQHYDTISAFIKSVRGSDPDAAIYWMLRMIEAGEDPKFVARRMIILASEDIGNADPHALPLATSCFTAIDYVGLPEGKIILTQVAAYLASAPKSNSAIRAIYAAEEDLKKIRTEPVPVHLRNAVTGLMKSLNYGKDYKYSHDYQGHFVEQDFLPPKLKDKIYYQPGEEGDEKKIKETLEKLWPKKRKKK
jgi:putative ATPase